MSLLAELAATAGTVKGPRCSVSVLLDTLPPDDAADLRTALDGTTYTTSAIYRVLKARGIVVGENTIARHRRKGCVCP